MHKPVTFGTAAALTFALAACGSADRSESSATDANAVTTNATADAGLPTGGGNMTTGAEAATPAATPTTAAEFAAAAGASDLFEITSSKLAATQAEGAQVKSYAAMMIKDHTKSTAELKTIASKENITLSPPALTPDMQSKVDALKAAKGASFDTLYLTQQVAGHESALKLHQGYAAGGDNAALKAFASKTAPIVSKHLDEARAMAR